MMVGKGVLLSHQFVPLGWQISINCKCTCLILPFPPTIILGHGRTFARQMAVQNMGDRVVIPDINSIWLFLLPLVQFLPKLEVMEKDGHEIRNVWQFNRRLSVVQSS
ncbi:hypothetical protein Nepgr_027001 [Nepenthes gracilis]|uniref:Uncharacterized protein n=1 Tax=Nepenthes gracilis TaxID=150966 RepID=A0AAD3T888_NEPGR|nr:hypothetical protein Nepgr_027001 [Nepenthes gracilis]